jgi:hypothetical protein
METMSVLHIITPEPGAVKAPEGVEKDEPI